MLPQKDVSKNDIKYLLPSADVLLDIWTRFDCVYGIYIYIYRHKCLLTSTAMDNGFELFLGAHFLNSSAN